MEIKGQFGTNIRQIKISGQCTTDNNIFDNISELNILEYWGRETNFTIPPTKNLILMNPNRQSLIRNPEVTKQLYCSNENCPLVAKQMSNLHKLTLCNCSIPKFPLPIKKLIITNFFSDESHVNNIRNISEFPNLKVVKCNDKNYNYLSPLWSGFPHIQLKKIKNNPIGIKTTSDYWQ